MRKKGNMTADIWWLNVYVMLSRARKLNSLLLLGLTKDIRKLLEAGPPRYIQDQLAALQAKAKKTAHDASRVAADMGFLD